MLLMSLPARCELPLPANLVKPFSSCRLQRRKSQLRVAQRAYRGRKEAAVSELKRRVTELELTIGNMNEAFVKLNKQALASGVVNQQPEFGASLRQTVQRFCELTIDPHENALDEVLPARGEPTMRNPDHDLDNGQASLQGMPGPALRQAPRQDPPTKSVTAPAMQIPQGLLTDGSAAGVVQPHQIVEVLQQRLGPLPAPTSLERWLWSFPPVPDLGANLPLPPLAAYHDTTFARRLERTSQALLYHLLVDPRTPPTLLGAHMPMCHIFGHAKAVIINRKLDILLEERHKGPLGNWGFPLLHVGGAGLHYPAPEPAFEPAPPQGWTAERNYGPWAVPHLDRPPALPRARRRGCRA